MKQTELTRSEELMQKYLRNAANVKERDELLNILVIDINKFLVEFEHKYKFLKVIK